MEATTTSAQEIQESVAACLNTAQKINTLHDKKEQDSNFKHLTEEESQELLGTINLTQTTLSSSPFADPILTFASSINADETAQLGCIVNSIFKTLSILYEILCSYLSTSTTPAWTSKKVKIFRGDFILRQKTDQFIMLYLNPINTLTHHIDDEKGKLFWESNFPSKTAVPWDEFIAKFEKTQKDISLKNDEALKAGIDFTQDGYVSIFEFSVFLKWFGPFDLCCFRMHECFRSGILCGGVPGVEANMLLDGKPEGYYLIRFSKTTPGAFALTFVDNAHHVKHCLLFHHSNPPGFTLQTPDRVYHSLSEFVSSYKSKLKYPISQVDRKILSKSNPPPSPKGRSSIILHNNTVPKEPDICIVCMDAIVNTVFLECGHLACCSVCAKALNVCPICRARIARVVLIFRA